MLRKGGALLALSCTGNSLHAVLLSPAGKPDAPGVFDEFDFRRCREFCDGARLCIDLAREISERKDLWKEN
jgi:hypothetical protein